MDTFVTRSEFEKVLKDLGKLKVFLADTFGAKFLDFYGATEDKKSAEENAPVTVYLNAPVASAPKPSSNPRLETISCDSPSISTSKSTLPYRLQLERAPSPAPPVVTSVRSASGIELPAAEAKVNVVSKERSSSSLTVTAPVACIQLDSEDEGEKSTPKVAKPPETLLPITSITLRHGLPNTEISETGTSSNGKGSRSPSPDSRAIVPIRLSTTATVSPPKSLGSFRKRSLRLDSGPPKQSKGSSEALPSSSSTSSTENEIIQCSECHLFIFSDQMENHRRNHAVYDARKVEQTSSLLVRSYKCPVCQEKCVDIDKYEEHLTLAHPQLTGKPCPICSKILSLKSRVKRHLLTHDELKLCCKICGKGYNRSDNLIAHMRNCHQDGNSEEPTYFYCSVCNNAFASREGRDKHFDSAHPNSARVTLNLPLTSTKNLRKSPREKRPVVVTPDNPEPATEESDSASPPIVLGAARSTEKIKFEGAVCTDFEYEGDDD